MNKRVLSILLLILLIILSSCSSVGNDVTRTYDEALNEMKQGKFSQAAEKLSSITFYSDSAQLALYCRAHAWALESRYDEAIDELEKLGAFRDASIAASYFRARKAEDAAESPISRVNAADLYDAEQINGFRDSTLRAESIRTALYEEAGKAEKAENWAEASEKFDALGLFLDSKARYHYSEGRMFEDDGENTAILYAYAAKSYDSSNDYQDSAERKQHCLNSSYAAAEELINIGCFDDAETIYHALGSLCDKERFAALQALREEAAEKARQTRITEADSLVQEGKYLEARTIYLEVDEPEMANESLYLYAADMEKNNEVEKAAAIYMEIEEYKDSRAKHNLLGKALMDSDPEIASRILLDDADYPGASDDLYMIALTASKSKNYPLSISIFSHFQGERDNLLRMENDLYLYGRQLLENDNPEHAAEIFDQLAGIGSAELYANMARYSVAERLEKNGSYESAAVAYDSIAEYADAADRADECRYCLAIDLKKEGDYQKASEIFASLGKRKDSIEQEKSCRYLLAQDYEDKHLWKEAIDLFESLDDYSDSKNHCIKCYSSLGWDELDCGEAENAYNSFTLASDEEGKSKAAFAAGEIHLAKMSLTTALDWYRLASDLPETEERISMIAQSLLNMEEDNLSEEYASVVENSEKTRPILYARALRSLVRKDEESAMRQIKKAGDNAETSERFREILSTRVEALVADEKYDDAILLCSACGDQDQADRILALKNQKEEAERQKALEKDLAEHQKKADEAAKLLEEGKYDEAAGIYNEIGEKALAENAIAEKEAAEKAQHAEEEAARLEAEKSEKEKLKARVEEASTLLSEGKYDEAISIYQELNDEEMINEAIYEKADALNQPELFLTIIEYKDSREKHYLAGIALMNTDPEMCYRILVDDVFYKDTIHVLYDLADRESKASNFQLSSTIFNSLASLPIDPQDPKSDCLMRSLQDQYQYGLQLMQQNDWDSAADIFDDDLTGTFPHGNSDFCASFTVFDDHMMPPNPYN